MRQLRRTKEAPRAGKGFRNALTSSVNSPTKIPELNNHNTYAEDLAQTHAGLVISSSFLVSPA